MDQNTAVGKNPTPARPTVSNETPARPVDDVAGTLAQLVQAATTAAMTYTGGVDTEALNPK